MGSYKVLPLWLQKNPPPSQISARRVWNYGAITLVAQSDDDDTATFARDLVVAQPYNPKIIAPRALRAVKPSCLHAFADRHSIQTTSVGNRHESCLALQAVEGRRGEARGGFYFLPTRKTTPLIRGASLSKALFKCTPRQQHGPDAVLCRTAFTAFVHHIEFATHPIQT